MEAPRLGVVLDASAGLALLREEPGAPQVDDLLRTRPARMSTVNAAEVVDVFIRRHRGAPEEVLPRIDELFETVRAVRPSLERSLRAGELRARHFDRRTRRLSLADCFALATAEEKDGSALVTTDPTLADAARAEGIEVVLLDS